jgi:hypothetical protein
MPKMWMRWAALACTSLLGASPEQASACSCALPWEQVDLELVAIEALDGGELDAERRFWPSEAQLVRYGPYLSFEGAGAFLELVDRSEP